MPTPSTSVRHVHLSQIQASDDADRRLGRARTGTRRRPRCQTETLPGTRLGRTKLRVPVGAFAKTRGATLFDRPSAVALSIRHVVEGELRLVRLRAAIHKLGQGGHDTRLLRDLLATMSTTLSLMKRHRDALQATGQSGDGSDRGAAERPESPPLHAPFVAAGDPVAGPVRSEPSPAAPGG